MPDTADPPLAVDVERDGDAATVRIEGEIEFATAPQLRSIILDLAHDGARPVVLNLQQVTFLDSAGISLLIQAKKRLAASGSDLVLASPRDNVRRVLEISGVIDLFRVES